MIPPADRCRLFKVLQFKRWWWYDSPVVCSNSTVSVQLHTAFTSVWPAQICNSFTASVILRMEKACFLVWLWYSTWSGSQIHTFFHQGHPKHLNKFLKHFYFSFCPKHPPRPITQLCAPLIFSLYAEICIWLLPYPPSFPQALDMLSVLAGAPAAPVSLRWGTSLFPVTLSCLKLFFIKYIP